MHFKNVLKSRTSLFVSLCLSYQVCVCVCLTVYNKRWGLLSSASGFYVGKLKTLSSRNASTKDKTSLLQSCYEVTQTSNSLKVRLITSIIVPHRIRNTFGRFFEESSLEIFGNTFNTGHMSCWVCLLHPPLWLFVRMLGYQSGRGGIAE